MLKKLILAVAFALLGSPGSAAPIQYGFTLSDQSGSSLSGILSFDSVADGTRGATGVEVTSAFAGYGPIATVPGPYPIIGPNEFTFAAGNVVSASFSAARLEECFGGNLCRYELWFFTEENRAGFWFDVCHRSCELFFEVNDASSELSIAPVPTPAALPLLLAGIAGFAFLRRKRFQSA
jgi:hypothetical protein